MFPIPDLRRAGTIASLGLLILAASSCSFNYGAAAPANSEEQPSAVFTRFVHRIVDKGTLVLEIRAERADAYTKGHRTELVGVDFTQYDAKGAVSATGRANSATVYTDSENAQFRGNVRLESKSENSILEAEELTWVSDTKMLSGGLERIVSVSRGDGAWVRGAGFEADLRRRSFSFQESTEGRFVPSSSSSGGSDAGAGTAGAASGKTDR
jgi:LPS export ABC transporter protein LptC